MTTYGIGHTDTINSCWYVVDAINQHPRFKIAYPEDHDKQRSIAQGFYNVSSAGFGCCAGAVVDGILIWVHKPSPKDCVDAGCSSGKFLCARKKKHGLNCQAVCDVRGRILDKSVIYPGSTSDCLALKECSCSTNFKTALWPNFYHSPMDDIGGIVGRHNRQRRYNYMSANNGIPLPRDRLLSHVASIGLTRPTPLPSR